MNYEFFLARQIISGKAHKSSVSAPIIKIAIVAIAIGLVMMMIAISSSVGLKREIRDKISAFNGHIFITAYDDNNSQVSVNPINAEQDLYTDINEIKGVSHIQAVGNKAGIIKTENTFEGIIYKGVGKHYNWSTLEKYLIAGRLPYYKGNTNGEVLMSSYMANRLLLGVGDRVSVFFPKNNPKQLPNELKMTIVGLFDSGFKEFDENFLIGDLRQVKRINKWKSNQVGGFEVFVSDFDKIGEVGNAVYQGLPPLLNSFTIKEQYEAIFEWIKLFDINVIIIITIMILVGGINMITALLALILERTQMIGTLKSMGANNTSIRKIFLYSAAYLILLGLFWGNIIGIGLLLTQKYLGIITLDPSTYYVSEAPVYLSAGYVVLLNIGILLLCLLMLLIPSFIVTKISPARAIRFA